MYSKYIAHRIVFITQCASIVVAHNTKDNNMSIDGAIASMS